MCQRSYARGNQPAWRQSAGAYRHAIHALIAAIALCAPLRPVGAQTSADAEAQRHSAQREAEERAARRQAPEVHLPRPAPAEDIDALDLPTEEPCFRIERIRLEGRRVEKFAALQTYLDNYAGRCIGKNGLDRIVKRASGRVIAAGYITTRLGIPEQDLGSGTLRITLIPGVIRSIRYPDGSAGGELRNAFPAVPGDLLNLRDLEQGMEQLKRVPSQDADLDIAPGQNPGESDIVVTLKRSKPWRLSISADDSGSRATGLRQAGINLAVDSPTQLNDLLTLSLSNDFEKAASYRGTRGNNVGYSIPWGYWTAFLSGGRYSYHQLVQGTNQSFVSHGDSTNQEFKLQRLIHRNQGSQSSLQLRLSRRLSRSFIDDAEILVQRRGTIAAELAIVHRNHVGSAQIDLTLARREGIPRFGGAGDAPQHDPLSQTNRYVMHTLDATVTDAFKLSGQTVQWNGTFRGQATADKLYGADQMSIGNRYTVRGFEGDATLSGERGWYLRNELAFPLADSGQSVYVGLDHGTVGGPSAQGIVGRHLDGAVIGMRGGGKGIAYDFFAGWAIAKPAGFRSGQPATGFQLTYQF